MTDQIGNGSIPLRIGRLIDATVYGGPYRQVPDLFWGVKMAVEIDHPHMVAVDTKDFCVPKVSDLKAGIVKSLMAMINEEVVYVGCWGGIGRTGLFLAALAKVQIEYRKTKHRAGRGDDPVLYVRKHFIPHAVETAEQQKYIEDLDVSDIVQWLNMTQTAMGMGGLTPARETELVLENVREAAKVRTDWILEEDKIGDPSFDRYQQDWKARQNAESMSVISQRGLSQEGRIDDQQTTIDELEAKLEKLASVVSGQGHVLATVNSRVIDMEGNKTLTKPTIRGKIQQYFRRIAQYHF